MKDQWYKPVKDTIGKYKAIKNRVSGELALVGKYGEIWQYSDTHCCVVITSPRIAKLHLPESKHPILKGDEARHTFPIEELDRFVNIIRVSRNRNGMIKRAEKY
jgi:hypothetical protein